MRCGLEDMFLPSQLSLLFTLCLMVLLLPPPCLTVLLLPPPCLTVLLEGP